MRRSRGRRHRHSGVLPLTPWVAPVHHRTPSSGRGGRHVRRPGRGRRAPPGGRHRKRLQPPDADVPALEDSPVNLTHAFRVPLRMLQMVEAFPDPNEGATDRLPAVADRRGRPHQPCHDPGQRRHLAGPLPAAPSWSVFSCCAASLDAADALHYERVAMSSILMLVATRVVSVVEVARHELTRPARRPSTPRGCTHRSWSSACSWCWPWVPLGVTALVPGAAEVQERRPRPRVQVR